MDTFTVNLLGALAVACCDVQDAAMAAVDLSHAELAALLALHARPGSTIGDLAATTGLTHSGAVRVVDRLGASEYVERRTGPDRRTVTVYCTREGHAKAKLALQLREAALADAAGSFTSRELEQLRRMATKLLAGLPGSRRDAWRICRLCDHGSCSADRCPVGGAVP